MQEREKLNKVQHMFSLKLNFMVQNTPSCFNRAIFNKVTKVTQDCTLYLIGPENLSYLLSQSDAKQKTIALSCTSGSLFDMFSL